MVKWKMSIIPTVFLLGTFCSMFATSCDYRGDLTVITKENAKQINDLCKKKIVQPSRKILLEWTKASHDIQNVNNFSPDYLSNLTCGGPTIPFLGQASPTFAQGAFTEFVINNRHYERNIFWEVLYGASWRVLQGANDEIKLVNFDQNTNIYDWTNVKDFLPGTQFFNYGYIYCEGGTNPGIYNLANNQWYSGLPTKPSLNAIANEYFDELMRNVVAFCNDNGMPFNSLTQSSCALSWCFDAKLILALNPIVIASFDYDNERIDPIGRHAQIHSGFTSYYWRNNNVWLDYDINTGFLIIRGSTTTGHPGSGIYYPQDQWGNKGYYAPFYFFDKYDSMMFYAIEHAK